MVLPLYLAMTAEEMNDSAPLPRHLGVYGAGEQIPPGAMLILDDRIPGPHDPQQIAAMVQALGIESVLLDFEREPDADSVRHVQALSQALPCPLAAPPDFYRNLHCAIFLPPCPLHVPLAEYLHPWQDREIWLDVTMQRQTVTVTPSGTRYGSPPPADRHKGGWFDEILLCRCAAETSENEVCFTLFDTPETLKIKLEQAAALGITRAVGLYQELNGKL